MAYNSPRFDHVTASSRQSDRPRGAGRAIDAIQGALDEPSSSAHDAVVDHITFGVGERRETSVPRRVAISPCHIASPSSGDRQLCHVLRTAAVRARQDSRRRGALPYPVAIVSGATAASRARLRRCPTSRSAPSGHPVHRSRRRSVRGVLTLRNWCRRLRRWRASRSGSPG
jgi:hypothetical protein